jgi:hypothetical protein
LEECMASIFRVEKSASEEPAWAATWLLLATAHARSLLTDFSTLKMDTIHSSYTSVHRRSTWRHIPEDGILHLQLLITSNYNTFANLHTKQITWAHTTFQSACSLH